MSTSKEKKRRDGWTASSSKVANELHRSHFFFFLQQHLFWKNSFEQNDIYMATCDGGAGLDLDGGYGERAAHPGSKRLPVFAKAAANAWSLHCREWECTNVRRVIGGVFCVHFLIQMMFWRRVKTPEASKTQYAKIVAYLSCIPLHPLFSHASNVIRKAFQSKGPCSPHLGTDALYST